MSNFPDNKLIDNVCNDGDSIKIATDPNVASVDENLGGIMDTNKDPVHTKRLNNSHGDSRDQTHKSTRDCDTLSDIAASDIAPEDSMEHLGLTKCESDKIASEEDTANLKPALPLNSDTDGSVIHDDSDQTMEASENARAEQDEETDEWMDILGNGKLKKKIVKAGKGSNTRPSRGCRVTVNYSASLQDGIVVDERNNTSFDLGDNDIVQAFDLGCSLMEEGEHAILVTKPQLAYGERGNGAKIPPNATLTYNIELVFVEPPVDYGQFSVEERLRISDLKRDRGNSLYLDEMYSMAMVPYNKAISILEAGEEEADGESRGKVTDMQVRCCNNLAACQIKMKAYGACIKSCDQVLSVEPVNVKALYRKAKCLAANGEVDDAVGLLQKAAALDPSSKIVKSELSVQLKKKKIANDVTKDLYRRMVGDMRTDNYQPPQRSNRWLWLSALASGVLATTIGLVIYKMKI